MKLVKAILSLLAALPAVSIAVGSGALLEQLEADQAALLTAEQDFRQRRERGELGATATADYTAYLQSLRERVVADCAALIEAGSVLPAGSPCAAFALSTLQPLPLDQGVPRNGAERTSILDAELDAGLAEFDQLLLREQERVRASAPRSASDSSAAGAAGSASGGAESAGEGGLAGVAGSASAGSSGDPSQQGQDGNGRPPGAGQGGKGAGPHSGAQGQPPGIPDGSDDDVVARQLRELAEQETDPEQRRKLWEEYRNYKQGID